MVLESDDSIAMRKELEALRVKSLKDLQTALQSMSEERRRLVQALTAELSGQGADMGMVMRFLAARDWHYAAAKTLIEKHLAWRKETLPIHTSSVREELLKEKYVLMGKDKEGHSIIIINECKMGPHTYKSLKECTDALIFGLELLCTRKLGPLDKFVVIFNRNNSTNKNVDMEWAKLVGSILQNNYPERLHKAFVVPSSLFFRGVSRVRPLMIFHFIIHVSFPCVISLTFTAHDEISTLLFLALFFRIVLFHHFPPFFLPISQLWRVARLFFDAKTANKVHILGDVAGLHEHIDPSQLTAELGGTMPYRFDIEESLGLKLFKSPRSGLAADAEAKLRREAGV